MTEKLRNTSNIERNYKQLDYPTKNKKVHKQQKNMRAISLILSEHRESSLQQANKKKRYKPLREN